MKRILISFLILLTISSSAFAQKGFSISQRPSWVLDPEFSTEVPKKSDASGSYYLLYDNQINIQQKQVFTQYAVKVINDNGLSTASSIDKSYDPAYEKLSFHSLYVLRGKERIDHLKKENFEIIQREENRSRAMYDGSLTAIVDLKDVKVGDVVVYSYTVTGFNPIFNNHFFWTFNFMFSGPTGKISARLLAPPSQKFTFKDFGKVPERKESTIGGLSSYSWEAVNVGQLNSEDLTPSWHDPYDRVQVTDFADWNELSEWEREAGKATGPLSKQLKSFVDSLKSIPDEEARILAAIRTIQDKVRYLSFNNGMNGYRPNPPSKVFSNKYGDCQDKSVLLATVLTEIGIESYPIVVSTVYGKTMKDLLPSPWNFNHVITQFKYRDSTYYVDGTMSFQRGTLKNLYTPRYFYGLSGDPKQPGLTEIPLAIVPSVIRAKEAYQFKEIGGPATLKVETVFTGREADSQRDNFHSSSAADMDDGYLNFYASDYPEIQLAKSVRFVDDSVSNTFTVFEEYDLPDFWKYDSADSKYYAEVYARYIASYLDIPKSKVRKNPIKLRYPADIELAITIQVSEPWTVTADDDVVEGPGFKFRRVRSYSDPFIDMTYSIVNTSDHVEAGKTSQYLNQIDKIQSLLSYTITYKEGEELPQRDVADNSFWVLVLVTAGFIGYVGYLLLKHYAR